MTTRRLRLYTRGNLADLPQLRRLPRGYLDAINVVAHVLPFRTNNYVVEELIDWNDVPNDPMFRLTFPQPGMLSDEHFRRVESAIASGDAKRLESAVSEIRRELNPHPAGQLSYNLPTMDGEPVPGVQHKYRETCLVFPSAGQTCHAYCTFCFRWAQFVGEPDLKLATDESMRFRQYIKRKRGISDVLFTGGDPMVMRANVLARYIDPLLAPEFDHVRTIRIGTKALSYWPYRFLTDDDTDELLRLLERVVAAGKHLAVMAHFNHWCELATPAVEEAMKRLQALGAVIRSQSPLIRHINDDARVWSRMWKDQVRLGCVPYYMFVERNTGAHEYFRVPLAKAVEIYRDAFLEQSGLGRTARGPAMSTLPGKILVEGITEIHGQRVFILSFIQARDPSWCKRPFFAEYDPRAYWWTDLKPAFDQEEFFFERQLSAMLSRG